MPTAVHPSLVEWLKSLPRIRNVHPVKVVIVQGPKTRHEFEAAQYMQDEQDGTPNDEVRIYCLGDWHALHRKLRGGSVCFDYKVPGGGTQVWYVACHSAKVIRPEFAEYHRFGQTFMLMRWTAPGSIDVGDPHKHYEVEFK